jgi:AraC-like DNA-binding protein
MAFGFYSVLLILGIVQGLVFAGMLVARRNNRRANQLLAGLMLLSAITLVPSAIGFAGAYDRYPWLLLAPLSVTLGLGPLLWMYVHRLLTGRMPRLWGLHLVPLALQVGYFSVLFLCPLQWRVEFNAAVHLPYITPIEAFASVGSAIAYWTASLVLHRRFVRWAPAHVSDSENYSLGWLRLFLTGAAVGFAVWAGFELVDELITPLSFRAFFWLDLLAAALVYGLAIAGFRHADRPWPAMSAGPADLVRERDQEPDEDPDRPSDRPSEGPGPDWRRISEGYHRATLENRWFLDPTLSLEGLARKLATNTWTLSRAINEGRGTNFNDFVNAFRVAEVQERLADPNEIRSILAVALASGFNSKTSFNRSFRKATGMTPSEYRRSRRAGAKS